MEFRFLSKLKDLVINYRDPDYIDKLAFYFAERLELKDIVYIGKYNRLVKDKITLHTRYISPKNLSNLKKVDYKDCIVVSNIDIQNLTEAETHSIREISMRTPYFILTSEDPNLNLEEFQKQIKSKAINNGLIGYSVNNKDQKVYITGKFANPEIEYKKLRVLAIMTLFNESDVIESIIDHVLEQELDLYIIDNWSTDGSFEIVQELIKRYPGRITIERFPEDGPDKYYEWKKLLGRVEVVASESDYDWCIHHDSDEIRKSPWGNLSIRDAISVIDALGFNAIDHTVLNFKPVEDTFKRGDDVEKSLNYFEINTHPGYFLQNKGWKNIRGIKVDLQFTGGHDATFEGRRVFPLKFLLKHYSIRSNEQANKKIFKNRLPRISERERSFNDHYVNMENMKDFIENKEDLYYFDLKTFEREYLIQRISGVGMREE